MLHPMGPHPQSMGFQPKTETNTADYQVSELKSFLCVFLFEILPFFDDYDKFDFLEIFVSCYLRTY